MPAFLLRLLLPWLAAQGEWMSEDQKETRRSRTCCGHAAYCAVHEEPYDSVLVKCTCTEGVPLYRHQWNPSNHSALSTPRRGY